MLLCDRYLRHAREAVNLRVRGAVFLAVFGVAACGSSEPTPLAATIEVVASSNGQTGLAGAKLRFPLAVIARADDGAPVARAEVRWTIMSGSGADLSDTLVQSDGMGHAQVILRLGPAAGEYQVRAELRGVAGQVLFFTATATDPPVLSSVTPSTFAGGDTLVLAGERLNPGEPVVEIGGQTAVVVDASASSVTVAAPACLAPGPVEIRVLVGGVPTNTVSATFSAPADIIMLAPGDYTSLEAQQAEGCATFPAAGPDGAEYLLTAQSVASAPGISGSYRFRGDSVVTVVPARELPVGELSHADRFHEFLRRREAEDLPTQAEWMDALELESLVQPVEVGHQRTFRVCESSCSSFASVQAEARFVGSHAAIYVDGAAPASGFSQAEVDSLGRMFDNHLYEVATRAFGAESDIDGNGVVIILLTPAVNRLTPTEQCATSVIMGYFFGALDLNPAQRNNPNSNRGEIFYSLTPDPTGSVTCTLTRDQLLRMIPVTFVHEFQHMISYNQHVLMRGGPQEVLWLNEALSHLAEDLAARRFLHQGSGAEFQFFSRGNLANAYGFLRDPEPSFVLPSMGVGTLPERGAGWLFIRWLVDQHYPWITRELVETGRTGAANVEAVVGEPFGRLLWQWLLATYVSDLPEFEPPQRLTYTSWDLRSAFASLHESFPDRFDRPFPIDPPVFDRGSFDLNGVLRSGSGIFVIVRQEPHGNGFAVQLTSTGGAPLSEQIRGTINVVRIR